jgi:hypothetical protein
MPLHWIRVSTGTPDPLTGRTTDPSGFESSFKQFVEGSGSP